MKTSKSRSWTALTQDISFHIKKRYNTKIILKILKPNCVWPAAAAAYSSPSNSFQSVDPPSLQPLLWVPELPTVPELYSLCLILVLHANSSYTGRLGALTHKPNTCALRLTGLLLDQYIRVQSHKKDTNKCWTSARHSWWFPSFYWPQLKSNRL